MGARGAALSLSLSLSLCTKGSRASSSSSFRRFLTEDKRRQLGLELELELSRLKVLRLEALRLEGPEARREKFTTDVAIKLAQGQLIEIRKWEASSKAADHMRETFNNRLSTLSRASHHRGAPAGGPGGAHRARPSTMPSLKLGPTDSTLLRPSTG